MAAASAVLPTKPCKRWGFSLSVQNFIVLPELLEQSDLLAVVPERLIIHLNNLKRFEPPLEIQASPKPLFGTNGHIKICISLG